MCIFVHISWLMGFIIVTAIDRFHQFGRMYSPKMIKRMVIFILGGA